MAVPAVAPVNTPVVRPLTTTVATVGLLLLQDPPAIVSVNVTESPAHTVLSPVTADSALTIIEPTTVQPVPIVYDTSTVPVDTPHKLPVVSMVASVGGSVDHVPPGDASCSVMNCPWHTIGPPLIAGGGGS